MPYIGLIGAKMTLAIDVWTKIVIWTRDRQNEGQVWTARTFSELFPRWLNDAIANPHVLIASAVSKNDPVSGQYVRATELAAERSRQSCKLVR
jgi:hypothetical protein